MFTFSGDVNISGTLTYEDVTNIDSVGIVTLDKVLKCITAGVAGTFGDGSYITAGIITADPIVEMDQSLGIDSTLDTWLWLIYLLNN